MSTPYTIDDLEKGKSFTVTHPARTITPLRATATIVSLAYPEDVLYRIDNNPGLNRTTADRFLAAINEYPRP